MEHAKKVFAAKEAFESVMLGDIGIVHNKVDDLKGKLDGLGTCIDKKMEALPGAADKEMKRAGDAAIEALAGRVAGIASTIAGDAAATERNTAFYKAVAFTSAGVLLCVLLFGGGGFLIAKEASSIRVNAAERDLQAATLQLEKATADLAAYQAVSDKNSAAEIEKIRVASGWAGTPEGKLAKRFFALDGKNAALCIGNETWSIEMDVDKKTRWCIPKRRDLFGGEGEKLGWKIP